MARAQERLDLAITALRRRGVIVRGEIGDADPMLAIADALASFPADEIVIATLPAGQSNWIERGLVEKATARFGIPIAHLVSSYDLVDAAAGANRLGLLHEVDARVRTLESGTQTE